MSIGVLVFLTVAILLLPQVFRHRRRGEPPPEIHGFLKIIEFIYWSYCVIWHRLRIDRRAPLPAHGPAILISNHTCGIDHVLLQAACDRILGFMIAREYYEYPCSSRGAGSSTAFRSIATAAISPPPALRFGRSRMAACSRSFPRGTSCPNRAGGSMR